MDSYGLAIAYPQQQQQQQHRILRIKKQIKNAFSSFSLYGGDGVPGPPDVLKLRTHGAEREGAAGSGCTIDLERYDLESQSHGILLYYVELYGYQQQSNTPPAAAGQGGALNLGPQNL